MKITAFDGSPRKRSNSGALMNAFLEAAQDRAEIKLYRTDELNLQVCRGCLMCNALKRCVIRKDDWTQIAAEILESDVLAFSTPIYFHHAASSMKKLLDRFRSFLHVKITETGIIHSTHQEWKKKLFLFTAHGSSSCEDAQPLIDLFSFMTEVLGPENSFRYITGTRLALPGQILMDEDNLKTAYNKLGLPEELVPADLKQNAEWTATAAGFADIL